MGLSLRPALLGTGHPVGLSTIFLIEVWERFGYYGMRALLILYMTKVFLFGDTKAYELYGAFTGLAYATPLLGGWLADKLLGYRKSTIIGAICMALGYLGLALPVNAIDHQHSIFYISLAFIIIGNGIFKPNTSSLVGTLYQANDPRRDSAYSIFYMGINLGAFIAPIACGFVGEYYGYQYGFLLTSFGLFLGLWNFIKAQHVFGEQGLPHNPALLNQKSFLGISNFNTAILGIILFIPLIAWLLQAEMTGQLFWFVAVVLTFYLSYLIYQSEPQDRSKIIAIIVMTFFSITFWACFEQAGSSLSLFADRNIDRTVSIFSLSFTIPTSSLQAINPLFIFMFAPLLSKLWLALNKRGIEPATSTKFALALLFLSAGFLTLGISGHFSTTPGFTGLQFLIAYFFLTTIGELCLSPVGLSMISRLAPARMTGLLMGVWFLSSAYGNYLSGVLSKIASVSDNTLEGAAGAAHSLSIYTDAFTTFGYIGLAASSIIVISIPVMKKLMGETKEQRKKIQATIQAESVVS